MYFFLKSTLREFQAINQDNSLDNGKDRSN
jgi:hypothetical protein